MRKHRGPECIHSGPTDVFFDYGVAACEKYQGLLSRKKIPDLLTQAAIQECYDLGAGAGGIGAEGGGGSTGGNTVLHSPQHCAVVVGTSRHIGEGIHTVSSGRFLATPQEGNNLGAGAGGVGAEGGVCGALGDALLHGPQHRVVIVSIRLHIGEGVHTALGSRGPGGPPQEGDSLGAGAGVVGSEGGGGGTGGDTLAYGPDHGVGVVGIAGHISERVFIALFRPLGIDRHVLGQLDGCDLVGQLCVGVPAVKVISGSGGNISGQVDGGASGLGHTGDLAAAVGFKGQGVGGDASSAAGTAGEAVLDVGGGQFHRPGGHGEGGLRRLGVGQGDGAGDDLPSGEDITALAVGPDGDGFAHGVDAGAGAAVYHNSGIGADEHGVVGEVVGGERDLLCLRVIGAADVGDVAVIGQVADHDVLALGDFILVRNGDFHIAAQLVQLRFRSVGVGDDQRHLHDDGVPGDAVQRCLLEISQVIFFHRSEFHGHGVLSSGDGVCHGVQYAAAHGNGGVLGGDGQAVGVAALAEGFQQTAGQDQLVHAFHAAQVHGHVAVGAVHDVGQLVLRDGDLGLAAIHGDGHVGVVHHDAPLDGQGAGCVFAVGLDVAAGGQGGTDLILTGRGGQGDGPIAVHKVFHRDLSGGVLGGDGSGHRRDSVIPLGQIVQSDGVFRGLIDGQGAGGKGNVIVLSGQARDADFVGSGVAVLRVGVGIAGGPVDNAFRVVVLQAAGGPAVAHGSLTLGDGVIVGGDGQGRLFDDEDIAGGGLGVLAVDLGGSDRDDSRAGTHDGGLAVSVHRGNALVTAGIGQRAAALTVIVGGVLGADDLSIGPGDGIFDDPIHVLLLQHGDRLGSGLAADGAGVSHDAVLGLGRLLGDDALVPGVAQGVGVVVHVAVAAAGAGIGGVALRRAGGGRHHGGVVMAQGVGLPGLCLAADGAGAFLHALSGAGGSLGLNPVAPVVLRAGLRAEGDGGEAVGGVAAGDNDGIHVLSHIGGRVEGHTVYRLHRLQELRPGRRDGNGDMGREVGVGGGSVGDVIPPDGDGRTVVIALGGQLQRAAGDGEIAAFVLENGTEGQGNRRRDGGDAAGDGQITGLDAVILTGDIHGTAADGDVRVQSAHDSGEGHICRSPYRDVRAGQGGRGQSTAAEMRAASGFDRAIRCQRAAGLDQIIALDGVVFLVVVQGQGAAALAKGPGFEARVVGPGAAGADGHGTGGEVQRAAHIQGGVGSVDRRDAAGAFLIVTHHRHEIQLPGDGGVAAHFHLAALEGGAVGHGQVAVHLEGHLMVIGGL